MRQWRGASPSQKNRRSAVIYVSTGLARLPRDTMCAHCYRRNYNPCFIQPLFGGRLLFLDRPQVGKQPGAMIIQPPFGGCLRLLIAIAPHRYASMARCIAIPKTAEERLYTLARGWLAYPVTSTHSQLPPKCGCINTQKPTLSRLEVPQKQSFRLRNRSRKLFRFGF